MRRNLIVVGAVCVVCALAGWGAAYLRIRSLVAANERADAERKKREAAPLDMFAEGDRIPLPQECVYGHSPLKEVRILWGHPSSYTDIKEQIERHEVVLAGTDVIGPKAKSRTVYCPTCEFILESGYGPWTRTAANRSSFVQPFSALVSNFVPEAVRVSEQYTQDVVERRVIGERLDVVTSESLEKVKMYVNEWAWRHELQLKPETLPELKPYRLYPSGPLIIEQNQTWTPKAGALVSGMVQFASFPEGAAVRISLLTGLRRGEKMSIDEAWRSSNSR